MMKSKLVVLAAGLIAPVAFSAPPAKKAGKKPAAAAAAEGEGAAASAGGLPAYGMGGCGLGAIVVDRNEMLPQLGATFLNGIYGNQSSAITTGTSNCSEEPRQVAQVEQEVFITANLSTLSKEAAQGSGEHIEALGEVFGCSEDGAEALADLCRDKHGAIFGSSDSQMVISTLRDEIKANEKVANNCDRA